MKWPVRTSLGGRRGKEAHSCVVKEVKHRDSCRKSMVRKPPRALEVTSEVTMTVIRTIPMQCWLDPLSRGLKRKQKQKIPTCFHSKKWLEKDVK